MKITPLNNINFGYNQNLNDKLVTRLKTNEEMPLNQALLKMNSTCNFTERKIKYLESRDQRFTDKNEDQINMLADYFIDAKMHLTRIINRLFPDLNYLKTECETYDREACAIKRPFEASDCIGTRKAYAWREILVDKMIDEIEDTSSYAPYDLKNSKNNSITQMSQPSAAQPSPSAQQAKASQGGSIDSEFVTKFSPKSSSPKSLDDVVGLQNAREDIEDLVIYPLEHPNEAQLRLEEYGIENPGFILFFGPPGCGKTMLAEAITAQTGCQMYKMDISKVGSSYVNKTSNNIAKAFDSIFEASQKSDKPVLVFMDEMDSMLAKRTDATDGGKEDNKAVNTLLPLIESARDKNVTIIGATNMYDLIDPAVIRRVDSEHYIGLPNKEEVGIILTKNLEKHKNGQLLTQNKEDIEELSAMLFGYSPSDIVKMTKQVRRLSWREQREIQVADYEKVLKTGSWKKINEKEYLPENQIEKKSIGFINKG